MVFSDEADALLSIRESKIRNNIVLPQFGFWFHMASRDYDAAVKYAQEALTQGTTSSFIATLHFNPTHVFFDPIRSHPEFEDLVRTAGTKLDRRTVAEN